MHCREGAVGKVTLAVLALVAVAVGAYLGLKPPPESDPGQMGGGPAPVLVEQAKLDVVADKLEALGTVRANEIVTLSSKVTERIESIHFEDGELVEAGELLVQLRDAEQRAELAQAEAMLKERRRQLERVRSVGDSGAVSQSVLDEELTRYDSAKAQVELYESRIADRRIEAPFSGKLGLRRVSPGELVSPGTELVTLSDLTPVKVDFTAPERYVGKLQAGLRVRATSVAYPGRVFEGEIQTVSPVVDPISRAAQARAILPNKDQSLRPGMLLQVTITLGQRESLTVSESALNPVGSRQYVFVVNDQQIAQRREVKVGQRREGRVEITEGLEPGELIITHGYRAREGVPVNIKEPDEVFTTQQGADS